MDHSSVDYKMREQANNSSQVHFMVNVLFPSGNSGKPKSQNVLIHFNKLEFKNTHT